MDTIALGLLWYLAFLFSTVAHEAAHAWAAQRLGDPTAYHGGQVSLDPMPHVRREPIGTVVFPILTYAVGGWMMGWASAPYDPFWAERHPRRAAWMALAGPLANLGIAVVAAVVVHAGIAAEIFYQPDSVRFTSVVVGASDGLVDALAVFTSILFTLNVIMFTFNLIPIPPLDGSAAITLLMDERLAERYREVMLQPAVSMFGLFFAWQAYGPVFEPLYRVALSCLYPGFV